LVDAQINVLIVVWSVLVNINKNMLSIKELRQFNIVQCNGVQFYIYSLQGEQPRLGVFNNTAVVTLLNFGMMDVSIDKIEGIDLNSEWLKSFGFTNNFGLYTFNKDCLEITCQPGYPITTRFKEEWGAKTHLIPIKLEYVHQLQNLYFALHNKELKKITHE